MLTADGYRRLREILLTMPTVPAYRRASLGQINLSWLSDNLPRLAVGHPQLYPAMELVRQGLHSRVLAP